SSDLSPPWCKNIVRIQCIFNAALCIQYGLTQLVGQFMMFNRPDTVFPGECSTQRYGESSDIVQDSFGCLVFLRCVLGFDGWMQIAVAGVRHKGDGSTVFLSQCFDPPEHVGKFADRYSDVARHAQ